MNLSLRLIENISSQRRTFKKITSTPKPAVQSRNNGLRILLFGPFSIDIDAQD